jgi:signal transduction histidine kinase
MKRNFFIFICCTTIILHPPLLRAQTVSVIDSAIRRLPPATQTEAYIKTCFFIADHYMDIEQYDSAQGWLNRIHEQLPAKTSSLDNYFLVTRQAEVYYYNNLQQLGLQESQRGLAIAKELNDSLLLADSYNFLGLFYMNMDSAAQSVAIYKQGIPYTHQPPYPKQYVSLTKPHHLYGNLSEALYKLRQYDSALAYNTLSLQKAGEIKWLRGIAVAHKNMGDIYLALQNTREATLHYGSGMQTAHQSADIDVELVCYGGLANCRLLQRNAADATRLLDSGFVLLRQKPMLNRFFALQFLTTAAELYKGMNNEKQLIHTLELKSATETANIKGANRQIQTILNAGLANEKRLLTLQVEEARQKQKLANSRFLIALIAMAMLGIGFLMYRYSQKQKLAVAGMRQKISRDLHDDIGASLSSLQIYSTIARSTFKDNPEKAMDMMRKISVQSKAVLENMGDIIWSMENNHTQNTSLTTKIKNYGAELLTDKNIECSYHISAQAEAALQALEARKNILLIIKEGMNNIAKYSHATQAAVHVGLEKEELVLSITDNGKGFDPGSVQYGNGLKNMRQRMEEMKGRFGVRSAPQQGTTLTAAFPLAAVQHKGW